MKKDGLKVKIEAVQRDSGRYVEFSMRDFTIPDAAVVRFYARKPSGKEVYNGSDTNPEKVSIRGDTIKVNLTSQTLAEVGTVIGEIQIIENKTIISSFTFLIEVKRSIASETAIESTNEYGVLDNLLNQAREDLMAVEEATERANDVADKAEAGEFTATISIGTVQTGEPGEDAVVENIGTAQHAEFNFVIPRGIQGPRGATGPQGIQGIPGNDGIRGEKGEKGDTGPQGPKGDKGATGAIGATGAQGIQGEKGDKGDKGDTGESGIMVPVNGFFTLSVDEEGDLWAYSSDEGTVPDFEYDSETGNLYFLTEVE